MIDDHNTLRDFRIALQKLALDLERYENHGFGYVPEPYRIRLFNLQRDFDSSCRHEQDTREKVRRRKKK